MNNFCSVGSKIVKRETYTLSHGGVFDCTKSGVGYLRVWEGHGQWFVLGEFLHCDNKKKSHANATKVFLGFFFANFSMFMNVISNLDIIKAINTKQEFEKNLYRI